MAIALSDNLQINFPKPTDARLYNNLTPYTSSAQVTGSINIDYRFLGLTVLVSSSTEIAEYWWKEGINDNQLILKTAGTEGTFLTTASNVNNGNVLTISKSDGSGYQITIDTGSNFVSYNFTASFSNQSTWEVNHNLNYRYVIIQTFDTSGNQIIPSEINLVNDTQAVATFPEVTSGTAVVTFGGATFSNSQVPGGPANSVQYNDGGSNWGGSNKFQFNGSGLQLLNNDESAYALETTTDKYYVNSNVFFNRLLQQPTIQGYINDKKYSGDILTPETNSSANIYDLVCLENNWVPVDQTSAFSTRMLGIIYDSQAVLIDGYIVVGVDGIASDVPKINGTLERGLPVYIKDGAISSAPFLSTNKPTTRNSYVRILGHLIQPSGDNNYWLMRFRPDNYWEIAP
jgi:hypothetical protein